MLRCRLSTVRTVVGGQNGIRWIVRRCASCLSLKLADPVSRPSVVQDRNELPRVVEALPTIDNEPWRLDSVEATPPLRSSSEIVEKPSACLVLDDPREGTIQAIIQASATTAGNPNQTAVANARVLPSKFMSSSGEDKSELIREKPASLTNHTSLVPTLRAFLSQTSWATHRPSTLQSWYMTIKSRSQLGALSSRDMSALISIFGSIAVRCSRDTVSAGDYEHPLASNVQIGNAREYWSFLAVVAQDKEDMGRVMSDSDRYWIMRTSLVELRDLHLEEDEATKTARQRIITRARLHYHHLSRHSRSPDTHVVYIDALLKYGDPNFAEDAVRSFLACLRKLDWVSSRYRDILWRIVFRHESQLSLALKRRILTVVIDRIGPQAGSLSQKPTYYPLRKTGASHVSVSDLLSMMLNAIFPSHPSLHVTPVNEKIIKWCRTEVVTNLCPNDTVESLFGCWKNLSLLAFSDASPVLFKSVNDETFASALPDMMNSTAKTNWEILCALRTLEKACVLDSSVLQDAASIVRTLWDRWGGRTACEDNTPILVVRAIYACFMRLAGLVKDVSLSESLHRSYTSRRLWIESPGMEKNVDPVLVAYVVSMIVNGAKSWDEALVSLIPLGLSEWILSATGNAVLSHLVRIDTQTAYTLYRDALRINLQVEPDVVVTLGRALATRGSIGPALDLLSQSPLPLSDAKIILDNVLRVLARRQVRRLPHHVARMLGLVMVNLYSSSPSQVPLPPKRHAEFALLLLTGQGQAQEAYGVFESMRRSASPYFSDHFLKLFLRALVQHRQSRLATRLYRQISKDNSRLCLALRPLLLSGLYRGGASHIALRASKTIGGLPARLPRHVSLMQSIKPGQLSAKIMSLKAASILSRRNRANFSEAKLLLDLLVRAGRMKAARKWFREARELYNPARRTVLGNMLLHGELLRRRCRNARQVHWLLASLDILVREDGFVPDRVTVNVLVKAILSWRRAISTQHVQALFDTLSASGYPIGDHTLLAGTVFGSQQTTFRAGNLLPKVASSISFKRHVRPLYKMFIKAFYVRGDRRCAQTVVGILKEVERQWHEQLEVRTWARRRGALRTLKRNRNAVNSSQ
ncbi:hypothetical protein NEOLEDRAFT_1173201 [Neolentinus lepideus HHB14362 ss-1]|uniref:Uncharacterized protein n=1 Tax=Neolentinus lepideus HHB14362 ss-1 TaxID=1314782 RepID=A0A165N3D4_9AGAM|nr:hypothetical protein NEOLEDRAFT_1173201 [Neolentinus lepideus HHB14362 ss-1]